MNILKKYILDNFNISFFSIFLPLFTIASVVFLIKLSTYTAVINLTVWEMIKLYIFVIPEILFYTLPITFFIASTITLNKLSNENEMVVIFSLGIKPSQILRFLLTPATILTLLLLVDYLVIFPHSKVLSRNFIDYKKSETKFNLSASEYGHSFGKWLLYIGKEENDSVYGDVLLFKKDKKEEVLISAKTAQLLNKNGLLTLSLQNGEGYTYSKDKFSQVNFQTMYINNAMSTHLIKYEKPIDYWRSEDDRSYKDKKLVINTLLSFIPMFTLFLVATFGIVHARHQKSRIYLYLFISIVVYYASIFILQKSLSFYTIPIFSIIWLISTYLIYKKQIVNKF